MHAAIRRIRPWLVGNPIYVISAAVMLYAATVLLDGAPRRAGDMPRIVTTWASLQVYELAVVGLAAYVMFRLVVRDDGATLLVIESVLLGAAFITLDELAAANLTIGLSVAAIGLALAAAKLVWTPRISGIRVGRVVRAFVWLLLALPFAWAPLMKKSVVWPTMSDYVAYCAWGSFAALMLAATVAAWIADGARCGRSGIAHDDGVVHRQAALASSVLACTVVVATGAHLFSLHHVFLANARPWYVAPVVASSSLAVLWYLHLWFRVSAWRYFIAGWLPFVALVFLKIGHPASRRVLDEHDPEMLTRAIILAVVLCLVIMTRRKLLTVQAVAALALVFNPRHQPVAADMATHVAVNKGWYLVAMAFVLLAAGLALSVIKSRVTFGDSGAGNAVGESVIPPLSA